MLNEGNREQACQNDNAVPACMAAATNNPNDIRGSEEGLYAVDSWARTGSPTNPPSPHPSLATTTLVVRGSVIRWLSLSQVAQVTEACPTLVLIAPWGIIDKTQGALHVGL